MKSILLFLVPVFLFATPAQVILIRHADQAVTGDALSLKGRERAMALAPFFYGNPTVLSYNLPVAVYAAKDTTQTGLTVKPLATKMSISLSDKFSYNQVQPLVNDILTNPDYEGKMVLVCWSHEEIPQIASLLGAKKAPAKWSDNSYDRVWMVNFDDKSVATFKNLPQKLLYGDSAK